MSNENVEEVADVLVETLERADMRKITNEDIQNVASILENVVTIGNGSEQVCQFLHFINYIELVQNKYNRTYIPHKKKFNSVLGCHNLKKRHSHCGTLLDSRHL